jgi:hypothetical protein
MTNQSKFASLQIVAAVPPGHPGATDAKYRDQLFEQYKLFVEKTHDYWDQFLSTNEFFLKANGVVLSAFAYLATSGKHVPVLVILILTMLSLALAAEWFRVINSLRGLNAARHEIIQEWELYLPAQPYRFEYHKLYGVPERKYRPIQPLYRLLPLIAGAAYIGLAVVIGFGVSLPSPK